MKHTDFQIRPGSKVKLSKISTTPDDEFKDKDAAKEKLADDIATLAKLQEVFYAADTFSLLIIFQALDAAGKDGAIKHVMSGINPQGCQVASFKSPSSLELNHDYLWRCKIRLPGRGQIGIFNRSYYEEVLIVRVHPKFLEAQKLPPSLNDEDIWERRFNEINNFEKYLTDNGTRVVKFYLHLSKEEQKQRFLDRIDNPDKNWKLSPSDVGERKHWDDYQHAYEDMLQKTSTEWAPWYVIPADKKWFSRTAIADTLVSVMKSFDLKYPEVGDEDRARIQEAREILLAEKD